MEKRTLRLPLGRFVQVVEFYSFNCLLNGGLFLFFILINGHLEYNLRMVVLGRPKRPVCEF